MNLFEAPQQQNTAEDDARQVVACARRAAELLRNLGYDFPRQMIYANPHGHSPEQMYAQLTSLGVDVPKLQEAARIVKTICNRFGAGITDDVPEVIITVDGGNP